MQNRIVFSRRSAFHITPTEFAGHLGAAFSGAVGGFEAYQQKRWA
jgi:hypothetical protein